MITTALLPKTMDYNTYRQLLEGLVAKGMTTGHIQSEQYLAYAKINLQRMQRLDKTIELSPELKRGMENLPTHYTWVVLTEGWCGDASQNLPVFGAIEKACPAISLRLLLR